MNEISQLVSISNRIGRDIGLVQGGGGNTSVKSNNDLMYIKASGWALSEMTEKEGYVPLQLERVRLLFSDPRLPHLKQAEQDIFLRQELVKANQGEQKAQPSLEVGLHAFLGRVVIHTHPPFINVITCMEEGPFLIHRIWPRHHKPPLWIPYANPGYPLASRLQQALEVYRKEYHSFPNQIFLENHGLCTSGEDGEETLEWTHRSVHEARNYLGEEKEASIPPRIERISDSTYAASLSKMAEVYHEVMGQSPFFGKGCHPFLQSSKGHRPHKVKGILYPDAVVYCGPKVFWIDAASFTSPTSVESRLKAFLKEEKFFPRVVGIEEGDTWFIGSSPKMAKAIAEVYTIHLQVRFLIERHGRPRFLNEPNVQHLFQWEAERYRQEVFK